MDVADILLGGRMEQPTCVGWREALRCGTQKDPLAYNSCAV